MGNLWIAALGRFLGRREWEKQSSLCCGSRGSDEAIVSDDPAGQHNPLASQGPLDGRVGVAGSRATLNRKALERVIPLGITYSWERELRWRVRRSHGADVDGT